MLLQKHLGGVQLPLKLEPGVAEDVPFKSCHYTAMIHTACVVICVFRQSRHLVNKREWCINKIEGSLALVSKKGIEWVTVIEVKVHGGSVPEDNESAILAQYIYQLQRLCTSVLSSGAVFNVHEAIKT